MTRTPVTTHKSHGKGQAGSSGEPGGRRPRHDAGAFELAQQLGITLPTSTHATPREKAKRHFAKAELERELSRPLCESKR